MSNQYGRNCCDIIPDHTNAFLNINGIPYLLAEYPDKSQFRQIDRSFIRSEIHVDQHECMRAVVDISIDDIGTRSDGLPNIIGNNSQIESFLKAAAENANSLQHRLDVVRKGMVVRINYQLENLRTKQIIRSTSEDLRIRDRHYFIDVNPRDINDNAIIINFSDTMVSTLTEFTHGMDRMLIRITGIQLFYECLKRENSSVNTSYPEHDNYLTYHSDNQNRHFIGMHGACNCNNTYTESHDCNIMPTSWVNFNRFYHFANGGKFIDLHHQEINDRNNRVYLIPCGNVIVNRNFLINPGHRIVFKLSIWKNDLVSMSNTTALASALGVQVIDDMFDKPADPPINVDLEQVIRMLNNQRETDHKQNHQINMMMKIIKKLLEDQKELDAPVLSIESTDVESGTITFRWNPVEGAEGYNVQLVINGNNAQIVYTGSETTYTHTGCEPDNTYTCQVVCYKGTKHSNLSNQITVNWPDDIQGDPDLGTCECDCDCDSIDVMTKEHILEMFEELGLSDD